MELEKAIDYAKTTNRDDIIFSDTIAKLNENELIEFIKSASGNINANESQDNIDSGQFEGINEAISLLYLRVTGKRLISDKDSKIYICIDMK